MAASPARTATLVAVPVALLAGVLAFVLLSGAPGGKRAQPAGSPTAQATGPVPVAAPSLADPAATACRALVAKLPQTLRDRARRPVSEGTEQNAAYGDPPIVLTCGGVAAAEVPKSADLLVLSGVCWFAQDHDGAQVWTTVDREVPVSVQVPTSYEPTGQWVIGFSPAITDAIPQSSTRTC